MQAKIVLVLTAILTLGAAAQDDAGKKVLDKVQGAWTVTRLEYNGKQFPAKIKFVIKGDQAVVEADDEIKKEYAKVKFKFDPSTMPKIVDVIVSDGVQKGATMEGIYELKGDEFKMCVKVFGKDRPTEFTAPDGSSTCLVVMKKD